MSPNPLLGVVLHWAGGFASASFYLPFRRVKLWSWETAWLVGGVFSWIFAPIIIALLATRDLASILAEAPRSTLFWCYFFGLLWGFGGLTFGLTIRYLGMSLGTAVALGYCATFGTFLPPLFSGKLMGVIATVSGAVIVGGVVICLAGIAAAGMAGVSKERALSPEQRTALIQEFDLRKGILVGTFCGIMSACFSYGLAAGEPIRKIAVHHGTPVLWQGLPILVVVLLGGFTTNSIWCITLNVRNGTYGQYLRAGSRPPAATYPNEELPADRPARNLFVNYVLCASAGVTWYLQFFFYSMGEVQMGAYRFSSWTLHMASIIIFGSLWGLILREWKGSGVRTMRLLGLGLCFLVLSTLVIGYGNFLAAAPAARCCRVP